VYGGKKGRKQGRGLIAGEGAKTGADVSNFGPVALVNLPNRDPVHIQNSENLQVFHLLHSSNTKKDGGRHDEGFD
jgi:hypothetical protein